MDAGPPGANRALDILLADDDPVSRLVASRLLIRLGHRVVTAADGREAVEWSGRRTFDVLLMDVQMPVLDGLQAAAAIRRREQAARHSAGGSGHVPILALTAGERPGDIEACLAAGMDGHLIKPLRAEALSEAVARLSSGPGRSVLSASARPPADPAEPPLDVPALLVEAGEAETLARLVRIFHEQAGQLRADLQRAREAGDAAGVRHTAQSLKDLIGHWRRGLAYRLAARLERDATAAAAVYDELMHALERLDDELHDMVAGLEGPRAGV